MAFLGNLYYLNFFYPFIFGCAGSLLLRGLSLIAASGGYSLVAVHRFLLAAAFLVETLGL